jgi:flagellar hook-associated protein 1 FlgK
LQQVQSVFNLSSTLTSAGTTALGSAINTFFSSLSSLANNPADTATRQNVLSAAGALAAQFNSAAGQIKQIDSSLNQQATAIVAQVNGLTSTIAKLNSQIASLSPHGDAGTLEDQRQAAVTELSQYIGLNQITTENNGITLTTTGGQVLVGGSVSEPLSTTQVNWDTHILSGSGGQDITSQISGGRLGGVIHAHDAELPDIGYSLDVLANGIATEVNRVNALGVDGYGSAGKALFSVSATVGGSATTIAVATNDPLSVAAAASGEGSAGNSNARALAGLATANIAGGTTAVSFYASLLDTIGNATATATADSSQQQASLTQLTTQRDSLSGVSLDQEAANLTQYQRSYEAAAHVFSIVNTLLASAINLGQGATVA